MASWTRVLFPLHTGSGESTTLQLTEYRKFNQLKLSQSELFKKTHAPSCFHHNDFSNDDYSAVSDKTIFALNKNNFAKQKFKR